MPSDIKTITTPALSKALSSARIHDGIIKLLPFLLSIDSIEPQNPTEGQAIRIHFTLANQTNEPVFGKISTPTGGSFDVSNLTANTCLSDVITCPNLPAGKGVPLILQFWAQPQFGEEFPPLLAEAQELIDVAAIFFFSLDKMSIYNTRAWNEDTDFVAISAQVGDHAALEGAMAMGDVDNGDHPINLKLGPFNIIPGGGEDLTVVYAIANKGGSDATIEWILNSMKKACSAVLPKLIPYVGSVVTDALNSVIDLFVPGRCDGPVVQDKILLSSTLLEQITRETGTHSQTRRYPGTESPTGCNPSNSDYSVTWTVTRPSVALSHHLQPH